MHSMRKYDIQPIILCNGHCESGAGGSQWMIVQPPEFYYVWHFLFLLSLSSEDWLSNFFWCDINRPFLTQMAALALIYCAQIGDAFPRNHSRNLRIRFYIIQDKLWIKRNIHNFLSCTVVNCCLLSWNQGSKQWLMNSWSNFKWRVYFGMISIQLARNEGKSTIESHNQFHIRRFFWFFIVKVRGVLIQVVLPYYQTIWSIPRCAWDTSWYFSPPAYPPDFWFQPPSLYAITEGCCKWRDKYRSQSRLRPWRSYLFRMLPGGELTRGCFFRKNCQSEQQ